MPTLPSTALFDKDLSLRSPFPRHVSTSTHTVHEWSRHSGARTDFRQIQRPSPLKAQPSSSLLTPQQSQSIPHSLRNLTQFPRAPSTTNRQTAPNGELNRIYNASPMPKIIDQAYSSLTVKSRPQPPTSLIFSGPSSRTIESESDVQPQDTAASYINNGATEYVPDAFAHHKVAPEPKTRADSPLPPASPPSYQDDPPFEEFDVPQEQVVSDECPVPRIAEEANKEDETYLATSSETTVKRKSTANWRQNRSKIRKTSAATKGRIMPAVQETVDIDPPITLSRRRREPESSPEFEENTEKSSPEDELHSKSPQKPRSKVSRIRTSVRQWFKGSFWDPPDSSRRKRQPPSQWWMPSEAMSKPRRKKRQKTEIIQEGEVPSKTFLSPRNSKPAEDDIVAIKEGEKVTRINSKEIYDFSDG